MLNLNVGSGTNRKQDYISVDLYTPEADEHWDIAKTWPYADESVDNIYACHVIEHLDRHEWENFYYEVYRVLKPGGSIEIRCPDMLKLCKRYLDNPSRSNLVQVYGLQSNPGEYHKNGFTSEDLRLWFDDMKAEDLPPATDYELHMRFTK